MDDFCFWMKYVQQKSNDGTPYLNQGRKTKTGTPEGQEYTELPRNHGAGARQTVKKQYPPQGAGVTQDPYAAQANALYQQLMSRGDFVYDLQADMLYRQYADQYSQLGRQAMMDATGTAAGLTGGYGSSFANLVGNQAYQQYMGQLNAMIPDFYDRAYQRWLDQGDLMLQQYQLAQSRAAASGGGGKTTSAAAQGAGIATPGGFAQFVGRATPEYWQQHMTAATPMDVVDYEAMLKRMQQQGAK